MQDNDNTKTMVNVKAVSFIHLFVQLAMEFNSFEENTRGGLLIEGGDGNNVLQCIACSSDSSYDEEHRRRVDTTCLAVLIRLRRSEYLLQEDIQHYELVHKLCKQHYSLDQRFRFLTEWCPSSLLQTDENGYLPFHWSIHTIRKFRVVLEAYFQYYPKWNGLHALFSIDNIGKTPFKFACDSLSRAKVMEVVEDILVRYTTKDGLYDTNSNSNSMILTVIDDTISLDGLYFIIRRKPDAMLSMLLRHRKEEEELTTMVSSLSASNNNNYNSNRITIQSIHDQPELQQQNKKDRSSTADTSENKAEQKEDDRGKRLEPTEEEAYRNKHGHCKVPQKDPNLGSVSNIELAYRQINNILY